MSINISNNNLKPFIPNHFNNEDMNKDFLPPSEAKSYWASKSNNKYKYRGIAVFLSGFTFPRYKLGFWHPYTQEHTCVYNDEEYPKEISQILDSYFDIIIGKSLRFSW